MKINVLFLGQKWIGERCFNLLCHAQNEDFQIKGVVSNSTLDVWWKSNLIYNYCMDNKIPFLDNVERNNDEITNLIKKFNINTIISVQHPWILPDNILSLVDFTAFNLHNAKLPGYKGHNSCNHAILNGEKYFTSTIHWMIPDVDMGPIAFTKNIKILQNETARSLYEKALISGEIIFKNLLDHLLNNISIPKKRIVGNGNFYPRNSLDSLREIKDITNNVEVDTKSRALFFPPFEPSFYFVNGRKIYVLPENFLQFIHEFSDREFGLK